MSDLAMLYARLDELVSEDVGKKLRELFPMYHVSLLENGED